MMYLEFQHTQPFLFLVQAIADYYTDPLPLGTPIQVQHDCKPNNVGLLSADQCLYWRYGQQQWIRYVWAVGLLAAGQSSTMTVSGVRV